MRSAPLVLVLMFVQQMVVGAVAGYAIGRLTPRVINRLHLEYEGLYPVLTIALVLILYGATTVLGGNGFLAVYLAGVIAGNNNFLHKDSLRRFHEGLAWLMQIVMFLTLGLLVFPSELVPISDEGLLIALFLMLVARPASIFVTLWWSRLTTSEKASLSWVGLKGAAPIILATFPLLAGLAEANTIFNLVFFIVLLSVLVQGTTLSMAARKLRVDAPDVRKPVRPLELTPADGIKSELVELMVSENSPVAGKQLVDVNFPEGTLVVLLGRKDEFIVPTGSTTLRPGDLLLVLTDPERLPQIRAVVGPAV